MKKLKVLVACEVSGVVRDAFAALGHDAVSCDILPSLRPGPHWSRKDPSRLEETEDAIAFVRLLYDCAIPHICIENPVGVLSTRFRKPDQIIQPYEFGHNASKTTCLWLKNLPCLRRTQYVAPRMVDGLPRWGNQLDSGQNRLPPGRDRWLKRAKTYEGIASAMASQWSDYLKGFTNVSTGT